MADLSFTVVAHIVDYPPRLNGPEGDTLAATLSDVATEFVRAGARGYDAIHDDAHTAEALEEHIAYRLRLAAIEPDDTRYRHRLVGVAALAVAAIQRWDRLHPAPAVTHNPEATHGAPP